MDIALLIDNLDMYKDTKVSSYLEGWGSENNGISRALHRMGEYIKEEKKISMLYFGNEFCEYMLPNKTEIMEFMSLCMKENLKPIFVTPVVSDWGIKRMKEDLECLDTYDVDIEIVVNDVGVLELLHRRYTKFKISLGRIFDKTSHDSRASVQELEHYYGTAGLQFARTPGILSEEAKEIFSRYKIERYEFDLPKVGLDLPKNGKFSLYWPYHYLTTGRVCALRASCLGGEEKFLVGNNVCARPCRNIQIEKRKPMNGFQYSNEKKINDLFLFQKGNTVFYLYEADDFEKNAKQFDRIVLQI